MYKAKITIKAGSLYNGVIFGTAVIIPEYDLKVDLEVPDVAIAINEALQEVSESITAKLEELPQQVLDLSVTKTSEALVKYYEQKEKEVKV